MGSFSIHVRLVDDDDAPDSAEALFDSYVERYDSVSYVTADLDAEQEEGVVVPERALGIDDIETFATIFSELRDHPAIYDMSLWGPESDRYPLRVYHSALRNLSEPDQYQFHAIDDRETLLICDTPSSLDAARSQIGASGLVEGGEAKF